MICHQLFYHIVCHICAYNTILIFQFNQFPRDNLRQVKLFKNISSLHTCFVDDVHIAGVCVY